MSLSRTSDEIKHWQAPHSHLIVIWRQDIGCFQKTNCFSCLWSHGHHHVDSHCPRSKKPQKQGRSCGGTSPARAHEENGDSKGHGSETDSKLKKSCSSIMGGVQWHVWTLVMTEELEYRETYLRPPVADYPEAHTKQKRSSWISS